MTWLLVLTVCCGGSTGRLDSQVGPSPVVLTDTSPGQLSVFVAITLGGYEATSRDSGMVHVSFITGDRPVKFVAGERVTCAGIGMTPYVGSFEEGFAIDAIAGKPMTCDYESRKDSAQIVFGIPKRLVILSPRDHDIVPHSSHMEINFDAAAGGSVRVGALATQMKAFAEPDPATSSQVVLDTTRFQPGPGTISLTEEFDHVEIQAPAFRSAAGRASCMTMIDVTWR